MNANRFPGLIILIKCTRILSKYKHKQMITKCIWNTFAFSSSFVIIVKWKSLQTYTPFYTSGNVILKWFWPKTGLPHLHLITNYTLSMSIGWMAVSSNQDLVTYEWNLSRYKWKYTELNNMLNDGGVGLWKTRAFIFVLRAFFNRERNHFRAAGM